MPYVFYIAAVCGALAVYLVLPHRRSMAGFGGLLAAGSLGLVLAWAASWYQKQGAVSGDLPGAYYYIFTAIAAAAALRVISHPRPVYAALYFVLVVLSTSGMLVLLEAEFMAFAMVIIYAGAILVTYMFVIMLATLPQSSSQPETSASYDTTSKEPLLAASMGFTLLAVVSGIIFNPVTQAPSRDFQLPLIDSLKAVDKLTVVSNKDQKHRVESALKELGLITVGEEVYEVDIAARQIDVRSSLGARPRFVALDDKVIGALVPNMNQVGLNLFKGHTLGIELAAVILLLSMVGAIVIAKRIVPEGEARSEA